MRRWALMLVLVAGIPVAGAGAQDATDWRRLATDADRSRLRGWRTSWTQALALRRPVAGEAALFDPDRTLTEPMPPAGDYRCRVHRLAAPESGMGSDGGEWVACSVVPAAVGARLSVEGGVRRPVGTLYPETDARAVFLGSAMVGDEARALDYGRDRRRDMAGLVERIGPVHWRLVLPPTAYDRAMQVMELVPAP